MAMAKKSLFLTAIIVATLVCSLLGTMQLSGALIAKPSVPEFTVASEFRAALVEGSNDYKSIEVTIKNQPFAPYYDVSIGWHIRLYYNIRFKEHHAQNWTIRFANEDMPIQSNNSGCTKISFGFREASYAPPYNQMDIQVAAFEGYIHRELNPNWTGGSLFDLYPYVFAGETSGWSPTQTITIPQASPFESSTTNPTEPILSNPTPTNTPTPTGSPSPELTLSPIPTATVPEFPAWIILPLTIVIALTAAMMLRKKQHKQSS